MLRSAIIATAVLAVGLATAASASATPVKIKKIDHWPIKIIKVGHFPIKIKKIEHWPIKIIKIGHYPKRIDTKPTKIDLSHIVCIRAPCPR